jgi:hypothetical protein
MLPANIQIKKNCNIPPNANRNKDEGFAERKFMTSL